MADDNTARYRSNEPYSRGPAAAAPANDPLAELARLIGQSDPFSEARREPRPAEQSMGASFGPAPAPSYPSSAAPTYDEPQRYAPEPVPPPYEPTSQYDPTTPRYAADYPTQGYAESQPAHQNWPGSPPFYPHTPQHDPFSLPQRNAPQLGGQRHDTPYADPHARGIDLEPHLPGFDPPYQQRPRSGFSQPLYPQEPEAGSMPPPHDDEFYDDTPPGGRRKGLLTVVAVFGLAVVGTAGAFGYRSLFNGPGPSGPPPVIRASGEPSKVAPPPQAPEQSASKFSYDRFGDAGKDERVVRREEKPVDIARPATQTPRSVFPSVPMSANTSAKPGAAMASANPPSALGEPRKVRTVPIRPDQGDVAANSPVASEPVSIAPPRQVNPPPPPLPSRSTDAVPVAAALPVAAHAAAPRSAAARIATHPAGSSPAPASLANAPLSLAPDASNDFPPPPSAPPPRAAAAPVRVASAPSSGGGSFLVQVTSQRSEADAQSSYRSIQQKYASVLGSQPHVVRKADLGSKGVYYRAMVGPFSSREQAVQLCSSLKQAGGDCVVQH